MDGILFSKGVVRKVCMWQNAFVSCDVFSKDYRDGDVGETCKESVAEHAMHTVHEKPQPAQLYAETVSKG